MYKEETKLSDKVTIINEKPTAVIGENKVKSLQTEKNNYEVDVFLYYVTVYLRHSLFPDWK